MGTKLDRVQNAAARDGTLVRSALHRHLLRTLCAVCCSMELPCVRLQPNQSSPVSREVRLGSARRMESRIPGGRGGAASRDQADRCAHSSHGDDGGKRNIVVDILDGPGGCEQSAKAAGGTREVCLRNVRGNLMSAT